MSYKHSMSHKHTNWKLFQFSIHKLVMVAYLLWIHDTTLCYVNLAHGQSEGMRAELRNWLVTQAWHTIRHHMHHHTQTQHTRTPVRSGNIQYFHQTGSICFGEDTFSVPSSQDNIHSSSAFQPLCHYLVLIRCLFGSFSMHTTCACDQKCKFAILILLSLPFRQHFAIFFELIETWNNTFHIRSWLAIFVNRMVQTILWQNVHYFVEIFRCGVRLMGEFLVISITQNHLHILVISIFLIFRLARIPY